MTFSESVQTASIIKITKLYMGRRKIDICRPIELLHMNIKCCSRFPEGSEGASHHAYYSYHFWIGKATYKIF